RPRPTPGEALAPQQLLDLLRRFYHRGAVPLGLQGCEAGAGPRDRDRREQVIVRAEDRGADRRDAGLALPVTVSPPATPGRRDRLADVLDVLVGWRAPGEEHFACGA